MTPSQEIADFIRGWESCRLKPYRDQAGLWTVGYGHLMGPDEDTDESITQEQANRQFDGALTEQAQKLTVYLARPDGSEPLQHEFDAVLSLVYNIGFRNFMGSTLRQCLYDEDYDRAAEQFERWNKVKNPLTGELQPSDGLTKRRRAERAIFEFADYSGRP